MSSPEYRTTPQSRQVREPPVSRNAHFCEFIHRLPRFAASQAPRPFTPRLLADSVRKVLQSPDNVTMTDHASSGHWTSVLRY